MAKFFKRYLACFLMAAMLVGTVSLTSAEAALSKPKNCRFDKWTNDSFTACRIKWGKVSGANYYVVRITYKDGSHQSEYLTESTSYTLKKLSNDHIYVARVRAIYADPLTNQVIERSEFSNKAYITPLPTEVSLTVTNQDKIKAVFKWNKIGGCDGYNLFVTTNPEYDDWYWNQSTEAKATETKATITKYRGKKLKKYQNYYVRIVTRRKQNGVFSTVPIPSEDYFNMAFQVAYTT